ncbi:MAG TPA: S-adenosylmethionine decarboxylase [Bacillota bacterium]
MASLILADFYLCCRQLLADEQRLTGLILEMREDFGESHPAVARAPVLIADTGDGFMGLFKVDGARIGFQTFPGFEYLALEVYVFTAADPNIYVEYLVEKVQPQVVSVRQFTRAEHLKADTRPREVQEQESSGKRAGVEDCI